MLLTGHTSLTACTFKTILWMPAMHILWRPLQHTVGFSAECCTSVYWRRGPCSVTLCRAPPLISLRSTAYINHKALEWNSRTVSITI